MIIEAAQAGVISDAPSIAEILSRTLSQILQIVGIVGIIFVLASGVMYVSSGGEEKRLEIAKKGLLYSVVGMTVILGVLVVMKTIVRMFVS